MTVSEVGRVATGDSKTLTIEGSLEVQHSTCHILLITEEGTPRLDHVHVLDAPERLEQLKDELAAGARAWSIFPAHDGHFYRDLKQEPHLHLVELGLQHWPEANYPFLTAVVSESETEATLVVIDARGEIVLSERVGWE